MNAERRRRLEKAEQQLGELISELESIKDDEDKAYNNMPESLQESERGEHMAENVSNLEDLINELENQMEMMSDID